MERALDAALEMTFPASDPIAVPTRPAAAEAREQARYVRDGAAASTRSRYGSGPKRSRKKSTKARTLGGE